MKIHDIFCENPRINFVLFYDVHKENMFTINLEAKRPLRLVNLKLPCCGGGGGVPKTTLGKRVGEKKES